MMSRGRDRPVPLTSKVESDHYEIYGRDRGFWQFDVTGRTRWLIARRGARVRARMISPQGLGFRVLEDEKR